MIYWIMVWLGGFLIGLGISELRQIKRKPDGQMVINLENPEKDVYRLELFLPLGELERRKKLHIRVKHDS